MLDKGFYLSIYGGYERIIKSHTTDTSGLDWLPSFFVDLGLTSHIRDWLWKTFISMGSNMWRLNWRKVDGSPIRRVSYTFDPQSRLWLCGAPKFGDVTCDQVLVQENGNIALNFAECIACTDT